MQTVPTHKNLGLMAFIFAAALMAALSVSAHGQWQNRNDDYYRNGQIYGQRNDRNRVSQRDIQKAYERGFKQGEKQGKNDARNGAYSRNTGYGNRGYGTNGGNGRYNGGNYGGGQIQRAYQDGYNRGYQEGYDRNFRNNRRYPNYRTNRTIFGIPY